MGLNELIEVFLNNNYFPSYIKLISVFIFLTFNGFIIFPLLFKTRNKYLLLGGGMITGPLVFLLILSTLSYIFKGPQAIAILFILYSAVCIGLFYKNYSLFTQTLSKGFGIKILAASYFFNLLMFLIPQKAILFILLLTYLIFVLFVLIQNRNIFRRFFSKAYFNLWAVFLVTALYIILIWVRAGPATMAGDVYTYWGIATSFARGNYPTVLPWQPNFLTVYHQGAFMIEGAIHSLASISISVVHTFFSAYIISAIFLFVTGMAREKTRSILCLIPAIFGLILFGGPVILIGGFLDFFSISNLNSMPQFWDIKGSWGAGATNLDFLYYINFYTFGLAVLLLIVYAIYSFSKIKSSLKDYIVLTIITMLCLSINEALFIPAAGIVSIFMLNILRKLTIRKIIYTVVTLLLVATTSFFVFQNLFRDSLLTPSPEHPRFKILKLNTPESTYAFSYGKEVKVTSKQDRSAWFIPSLPVIIFLTLTLSLLNRSSIAINLGLAALVSSIPGYVADNYYVHAGSIRFFNQAYELSMFSLGFLIINLKIPTKPILSLGTILFVIAVFGPQTLISHARILSESLGNNFFNYVNGINYQTPIHEWVKKNLPYNERIIFIDEYPDKALNSPSTLTAQEYYGFFVPTAPPFYKVLQADFGSEWYDAVISLSPQAVKELELEYVFIYYQALPRFSKERREQLDDPKYFEKVYSSQEGVLFRVTPIFKQLPEEGITLRKMVALVPDGKRVYLDRLRLNEMRRGLILAFSKKTKLYGPQYSQAGDYFGLIETDTPFNAVKDLSELEDIDYVLMSSEKDPPKLRNYSFYKFAENTYLILWAKVTK